jgi:hypothetical protein
MMVIKTDVKVIIEIPDYTAGNGDTHSKNINEEI